jgi:hypothetical protein
VASTHPQTLAASEFPIAIPSFDHACDDLRALLATVGRSTELVWAFREDLFALRPGSYVVRSPLPEENALLARHYFDRWTPSGALELRAICALEDSTLATPWSPLELPGGVQGWEQDFKASVQRPWGKAFPVTSSAAWWLQRRRPAYKRFQNFGVGIPLRPQTLESSGRARTVGSQP